MVEKDIPSGTLGELQRLAELSEPQLEQLLLRAIERERKALGARPPSVEDLLKAAASKKEQAENWILENRVLIQAKLDSLTADDKEKLAERAAAVIAVLPVTPPQLSSLVALMLVVRHIQDILRRG